MSAAVGIYDLRCNNCSVLHVVDLKLFGMTKVLEDFFVCVGNCDQVTGFLDPREATEALRQDPFAYDLVVTDYNMPGYCGVNLVRDTKTIRSDLPVALASGYITTEIEAQAIAAGALALIYKPNDVDELCETVDRLIRPGA